MKRRKSVLQLIFNFKSIILLFTSSPMQYFPEVFFRIGSRAGGEIMHLNTTGNKMYARTIIKTEWSFHQPWKPRLMKCCAHSAFSAPIFCSTYKFWNIQTEITVVFFYFYFLIKTDESPFKAHLQRLNSWSNEVTYYSNLSTCLWVCRQKTRSWSGLIDVLNHCKLHE